MWNADYLKFLVCNVWQISKPVEILDCGGGYGALGLMILPLLPKGSRYVGGDFSEKMIAEAKNGSIAFRYFHFPNYSLK